MNVRPEPIKEAVKKLGQKTPLAAVLTSEQWSEIPAAIRERAQFSATVSSARILNQFQKKLSDATELQREIVKTGKSALVTRSSFITDMREDVLAAGLSPDAPGVRNLASRERLGLIFDIQTQSAENYARWKMGQDEDVLDAFPAQRFIRYEKRKEPRNWRARWREAGEAVGWKGALSNRMVALKTSPIWAKLSYFGSPWPPFDFNSGMGLEDIDRDEAEELKLIRSDETIEPMLDEFSGELEMNVDDLNPELKSKLKAMLGDSIEFKDGKAILIPAGSKQPAQPGEAKAVQKKLAAEKPKDITVPRVGEDPYGLPRLAKIKKHINSVLDKHKDDPVEGMKAYKESLKVKNPLKAEDVLPERPDGVSDIRWSIAKEAVQEVLDILPPRTARWIGNVNELLPFAPGGSLGAYSWLRKAIAIDMKIPSLRVLKSTMKHEFMHHVQRSSGGEHGNPYMRAIKHHFQDRTEMYEGYTTDGKGEILPDDFIKGGQFGAEYYAGKKYPNEVGTGVGLEIPTVYMEAMDWVDEPEVAKDLLNDIDTLAVVMSIFYQGRHVK